VERARAQHPEDEEQQRAGRHLFDRHMKYRHIIPRRACPVKAKSVWLKNS
jgi:hypothetical protein